jgi:hypothetical protein
MEQKPEQEASQDWRKLAALTAPTATAASTAATACEYKHLPQQQQLLFQQLQPCGRLQPVYDVGHNLYMR